MNEDMTFCSANCEIVNCVRNNKNITRHDILHSFSDFNNVKGYCPKAEPKQTNYDRIKSMSVEEMADLLKNQVGCGRDFIPCGIVCNGTCTVIKNDDCKEKIKQWLLQEVSENDR